MDEAFVKTRVIVFDLDGTLVNAYPAVVASVNYTLEQLGFKRQSFATIKSAVGWGDKQLMAGFVGDKLANKATRIYRPHHAKVLATHVTFLPYVKATLLSLKAQGYRLAICSNRPLRFTLIILQMLKIRDLFDVIECADKSKHPKPEPDMLFTIARKFKISLKEMIFVGDMTIDIETGRNAGVRTIAVTTGSSTLKELKALKPWAIIARIVGLKKLI